MLSAWDGPWVGYYPSGPLLAKGTMNDGIQDGPWIGYHSNGQSHYRGTLKDGKRDGLWFSYNEDGTVDEKYTGTFKNGVKVK
jgi:antitoxin component YwqK of YwqJK toxin-antitoxin module